MGDGCLGGPLWLSRPDDCALVVLVVCALFLSDRVVSEVTGDLLF